MKSSNGRDDLRIDPAKMKIGKVDNGAHYGAASVVCGTMTRNARGRIR